MSDPIGYVRFSDRPETGPMQFGEDWPGYFIRGDNAVYLGMLLEGMLKDEMLEIGYPLLDATILRNLARDLQSSDVRSGAQVQKLAPFEQCKEPK